MRRIRHLLFAFLVVGLLLLWWLPAAGPDVEPGSVLVLELEGEYVEAASPPLLSRLLGDRTRPFVGQLSEIAKAERDERLEAIVFRVRDLSLGWAKAQELRAAIEEAGSRGRRTAAYLELASFGANLEYYVASAADEVYVAPATRAPLVGLAAEYLFLGGLWERLGIEVEVERIGRYKSAAETIAGREMSDATREMADALLDSVDAQFVAGIAASRDLPERAVRDAIAAAPVDPAEMEEWGLVDGVMHRDELVEKLGGGPVVSADTYAGVAPSEVGFSPVARFALVYGSGAVVMGEGDVTPGGAPVMASDTVARALEEAAADPEVDAVIFRVDSPGGSPLASDVVWRAAVRAREGGKPVVASFSDVAASGGYYVAAGADAIVASPASITGSIGVFVLRPVLAGALEKLDVGFESLTRGPHADLQLSTRPLDPATRGRLRAEVASIYDLFVERVADGRSLDAERVDAVGRGRVWTGAQAAEVGLVDTLGGIRDAVREAKRRIGLDEDADVSLVVHPPPRSLLDQLNDALGLRVRAAVVELPLQRAARRALPWLRAATDRAPTALLPFSIEIH